ncbi:o-methyltransferase [Echria macrotheca]|uniref:O-methyltransferase n=1 Tax=Echria macrotheca TaxID=438768 RepID=A0AAJ0BHZ4_9PEZI|nr:o-methyltransferase [Echria macrotheca]
MPSLKLWLNGNSGDASNEKEKKKARRRSAFPLSVSLSRRSVDLNHIPKDPEPEPSPVEPTPPSRMVELAQKIARETERVDAYLRANNLPTPSFDVDSPAEFPKLPADILKSKLEIIIATKELNMLAHGPRESVRWGLWEFLDVLALEIINHFGIAKLFPANETITLKELEAKTSLDPINLARVLRLAMTKHIFREPSPGVIAHTAASRVLAEDGELQAWVGLNTEDIFPAAAHVLPAIKTYPEATSLTRAGFCFAFDTVDKEPMFVTFGKDPSRARRMAQAMASLTGGEGYEVSHLVDVENGGYDFSEIDAAGGTMVDLGGSHGFVCVDIAKRWKNMKFIVQDLPKTVESAPKPLHEDPEIAGRITLQAHDFFSEQPVKGADVYFFRWIFHNYSAPYAVKLLKNLVPALKPGARIIINDHCLLEPGQENPWDEAVMRRMDMVMLAVLNAQERTEAEFREIFKAAGEGFVFKGVTRPKGCRMGIIEAIWQPTSEAVATSETTEPINGEAIKAAAQETK